MKITILIPAYNEESRILLTLEDVYSYFKSSDYIVEIIVVDDGSIDSTSHIVRDFARNHTISLDGRMNGDLNCDKKFTIKLFSYPKNEGKGYAVRFGALNATGEYLLVIDADGSTPVSEFQKLLNVSLKEDATIVIGSRALPSGETVLTTSFHRKYLGRLFNLFVRFLSVGELRKYNLQDTQCGFKLFSKKAYKTIFPLQTISGFAFDCELLTIASLHNIVIREVSVNWTNIAGSKVNLFRDPFFMIIELLKIRYQAAMGIYKGDCSNFG
ncbi:MAG TPA: glycosyltransferase family 2 protein [Oligoflexia bacterium]|nr:glycosyltransferase family 2 protein [Oligoflexia bacterium]HMP47403.1 glycosyltransferase family 2 protein [Oligoflexia bacterium]